MLFNIADLVFHILNFLDENNLRNAALISKLFFNTIHTTPALKEKYYESGHTLTLFFKQGDRVMTLKAYPNNTINELRNSIDNKANFRFIYAGKQLAEEHTLEDYGIKNEATIHITLPLSGD